MQNKKCRICEKEITPILSLGKMPIVNYFLSKKDLKSKEKKYPLNFCLCQNCGLAQLDFLVSPNKIFLSYDYISSTSNPLKKHLEHLAELCSLSKT